MPVTIHLRLFHWQPKWMEKPVCWFGFGVKLRERWGKVDLVPNPPTDRIGKLGKKRP